MTASTPGAEAGDGPLWGFLLRPRWLAWHATMVVAFCGMGWLGYWQMTRALNGNGLSWAYTFEWPLFAVFAVVFWARTIRDELRIKAGTAPPPGPAVPGDALPAGVGIPLSAPPLEAGEDGEDDPSLAAYNAYLARLHGEVKGHGRWHGLRN